MRPSRYFKTFEQSFKRTSVAKYLHRKYNWWFVSKLFSMFSLRNEWPHPSSHRKIMFRSRSRTKQWWVICTSDYVSLIEVFFISRDVDLFIENYIPISVSISWSGWAALGISVRSVLHWSKWFKLVAFNFQSGWFRHFEATWGYFWRCLEKYLFSKTFSSIFIGETLWRHKVLDDWLDAVFISTKKPSPSKNN